MRGMVLEGPGRPLRLREMADPPRAEGAISLAVEACGVCRTDLHLVDGELEDIPYPVIPGHQVVGTVLDGTEQLPPGTRVGVPWLGYTCGRCRYCLRGLENLCDQARFTGYTLAGGYAERMTADPRFCFPLPQAADPAELAPLLCAGLIGYRALKMCGDAEDIGLYGFGAAAHILAQVLRQQGRRFHAFTRPGDRAAQASAEALGAASVGSSDVLPSEPLDAAIIFAPIGSLVPQSLRAIRKGGTVVCAGIHMSDIPRFPYALLWGERHVRSVANLTREDGSEFLSLASRISIETKVTRFPLAEANEALAGLRAGAFTGSAVLEVT